MSTTTTSQAPKKCCENCKCTECGTGKCSPCNCGCNCGCNCACCKK